MTLRFRNEQEYNDFIERQKRAHKAPARQPMTQSEETLQRQIVEYLRLTSRGRYRVFAVPAGGHMTPVMGARRKRAGAVAGVPDLLLECQGGQVIEMEVKTSKGRLSKAQVEWRRESHRLGIAYHVVRSLGDVEAVLRVHNLS